MRNPVLSEENNYSAWDSQGIDDDIGPLEPLGPIELLVEDEGGLRLDKWLAKHLSQFSRTRIQHWIEAGFIEVNEAQAAVRQPVWEGDRVRVNPQEAPEESAFRPEPMELDIVFEDPFVLVIDKPAGLVVHPAAGNWQGTLLNGLLHHLPSLTRVPRAGIVHRLDKDTSGLMVVAKTIEAQTDLVRQLQSHSVARHYLAVVHGAPPSAGTFRQPLGRSPRDRKRMAAFKEEGTSTKPAVTHYETLARGVAEGGRPVALVCCRLETGRTHQIRVHMQAGGFPLYGDPLYGRPRQPDPFARQALHAARLGFLHPHTHAAVRLESPLPADLAALLLRLDLALPSRWGETGWGEPGWGEPGWGEPGSVAPDRR
jgi:23S rRNA pseudouridine1911/1915/1917 synthase